LEDDGGAKAAADGEGTWSAGCAFRAGRLCPPAGGHELASGGRRGGSGPRFRGGGDEDCRTAAAARRADATTHSRARPGEEGRDFAPQAHRRPEGRRDRERGHASDEGGGLGPRVFPRRVKVPPQPDGRDGVRQRSLRTVTKKFVGVSNRPGRPDPLEKRTRCPEEGVGERQRNRGLASRRLGD
ncbi:hypothetical protein THAOC_25155, partial [Thalassiosira oceanica]